MNTCKTCGAIRGGKTVIGGIVCDECLEWVKEQELLEEKTEEYKRLCLEEKKENDSKLKQGKTYPINEEDRKILRCRDCKKSCGDQWMKWDFRNDYIICPECYDKKGWI